MKVKILKLIAGWKGEVGDVMVMPEEVAKPLIDAGIVEPIEDELDEELAMWGLVTIPLEQKEVIKFACDLFNGVIVDVEKAK